MSSNLIDCFELIGEIRKCYKTYDSHLHPIELFSGGGYVENKNFPGLFSMAKGRYQAPSKDSFKDDSTSSEAMQLFKNRPGLIALVNRRAYAHTGPLVFRNYMDLAGIDRGMMLPVARGAKDFAAQMSTLSGMFRGETRFELATSIPEDIENKNIENHIHNDICLYGAKAVKVHPNVSRIDLSTSSGKSRIEWIIDASAQHGLPVIIHGGRSIIPTSGECGYAIIENLRHIRLQASVPVILAHGGCWGHTIEEVDSFVLPVLRSLMKRTSNFYIDISSLSYQCIKCLVINIEKERILFGSDGLYVSPVIMVARMARAVRDSRLDPEDALLHMLSKNPAEILFKESHRKDGPAL